MWDKLDVELSLRTLVIMWRGCKPSNQLLSFNSDVALLIGIHLASRLYYKEPLDSNIMLFFCFQFYRLIN